LAFFLKSNIFLLFNRFLRSFSADDGFDETLIPLDFKRTGQIRDDDLFKILVVPMKAGVTLTCLFDCCHSGTVLDLPYNFQADDHEFTEEKNYKFTPLLSIAAELKANCINCTNPADPAANCTVS